MTLLVPVVHGTKACGSMLPVACCSPNVRAAMLACPRASFVPAAYQEVSWHCTPAPVLPLNSDAYVKHTW